LASFGSTTTMFNTISLQSQHLIFSYTFHIRGPRCTPLQSQLTTTRVFQYDKAPSDLYHSSSARQPPRGSCTPSQTTTPYAFDIYHKSHVLSPFTQEAAIRGDPRVNYPTSAPALTSVWKIRRPSRALTSYTRGWNRTTKRNGRLSPACLPHRVTCRQNIERAKKKAPTGPPKGTSRS